MSLDGKLLARAKARLDKRRADNEEDWRVRRETAYAKNPRIRDIDRSLRESVAGAVTGAIMSGGDPTEALDLIREENLDLQERRGMELLRAGLPMDYLDEKYICPKCRDTGYRGTELCSCLMELYRDEQRRELSALLKLGEDTFDSFDLSYYSAAPRPLRPGVEGEGGGEQCHELKAKIERHVVSGAAQRLKGPLGEEQEGVVAPLVLIAGHILTGEKPGHEPHEGHEEGKEPSKSVEP